jgi:hypothetical protein
MLKLRLTQSTASPPPPCAAHAPGMSARDNTRSEQLTIQRASYLTPSYLTPIAMARRTTPELSEIAKLNCGKPRRARAA